MIHSLNALAESLAERAGRQHDIPFREQIKVWIGQHRSSLIRQTLQRHPKERQHFVTSLEVELEQTKANILLPDGGCPVLRSKCQLPSPLHSNGILFDFVGTVDMMRSFALVPPHTLMYYNAGNYTGSNIRATWVDNYLFVYNTLELRAVRVHGVFDNLDDLNKTCAVYPGSQNGACYDHDQPYPVSLDIQQRIVQSILSIELRRFIEEPDTEIKVD